MQSLAIFPGGAQILLASFDNPWKLWRAADGTLERTLEDHVGVVASRCFSPDGAATSSAIQEQLISFATFYMQQGRLVEAEKL